ncbi:unnamed protein product [Closterium sp. NIES-64]|nr:unnamed protein product [Closterium sp. NIES-64]
MQFPDTSELPRWADLLKKGIDIFALDYDAILAAMYALTITVKGDCYLSVPPDPGIGTSEVAALGASASAALGPGEATALGASASTSACTAPTEALHTFTLESGASRCFFRDRTALEQLPRPVAVSLADPSGGPVLATSTTALPCPAVPSGTLSGLYLPSFSTNLVAGSALQDAGVHRFTPAYERVTQCTALPPLPPSPTPPCLPCVEGRQRAAPHSSSFPPTEAPLQTLHLDVWGPARVRGQGHETYFLLVVDNYTRYTTVFPLRTKGEVPYVLIPWIRAARLQLRQKFQSDFPVLRLHTDRGGEFSSDLLAAYCAEHGITQSFTLPASPQQNGIAERRIGLVMEVARTSMIHAAAPHFLWPFAVGDASVFRVWGCRAFVRDTSTDKLSSRAVPCIFLGFVPDAPGWQFYHPTSRRVFASQDVTFEESVPFYRLFPYRTAPLPPPPLFLTPGAASADPLPPQGAAPSGVSQVDPVELVEVAVDSGPVRGTERAEPGGAGPGGAEPRGAGSGGAEPGDAESAGAETGGAESGGAETTDRAAPAGAPSSQQLREWYSQCCSICRGAPGAGGSAGVGASRPAGAVSQPEPPSPQRLREWYARRCSLRSGAPGVEVPPAGDATAAGGPGAPGGAAGAAGSADGETGAAGGSPGAAGGSAGAAGGTRGAGGAVGAAGGSGGAAGGTGGARGAAGTAGGSAGAAGGSGAVSAAVGGTSRPWPYFIPLLQHVLGQQPPPSPPPSVVCPPPVQSQSQLPPASPLPDPPPYTGPTGGLTERREPEPRPLWPVSRPVSPVRTACASRRVPPERLPPVPGTHRMSLRPSTAPHHVPLPSPPPSSLPALANTESDSVRDASPTVTRLLATAVTDPSFELTAASALVAELVDFAARCRLDYATSLVTGSESVCPPSVGAATPHLVSMLIAPEGDPDAPDILTPQSYAEAIEGPYSSHWQSAMDAEMASLKSTGTYVDEDPPPGANIVSGMWIFRGSLHEEIWLRRPPGFTGSFPPGTQWSLRRPVYGLRQAPREWHDTLRTTLATLVFAPSTADPSLFLCTDTSLPSFYILVYIDDLVFATTDTEALAHVKSELQKRHTCTDLAMAAQELRWLTYLLTDLGERPSSPPVLYVDNKAAIALCAEHRLEHRTKHIALRYFLARELQ